MPRTLMPILGLIGLAILCVLCLRCHGPRIQAELAEQGQLALAEAGAGAATLRVKGRNAVLTGRADSAEHRDRLVEMISEIPGMRSVDSSQLSIPIPVRFELARSAEGVALRGELPSVAHRDLIASTAWELWGAGTAVDELAVDPAVEEPEWLDGLPAALGSFSRRTQDGTFAIDGGKLTIGGRMYAESARRALLARMGGCCPAWRSPISPRCGPRPPSPSCSRPSTTRCSAAPSSSPAAAPS